MVDSPSTARFVGSIPIVNEITITMDNNKIEPTFRNVNIYMLLRENVKIKNNIKAPYILLYNS